MIDTNRLYGIIAERRMSQAQVAKCLGMSDTTFYRKMKKGAFGTDEVEEMVKILEIENPADIF